MRLLLSVLLSCFLIAVAFGGTTGKIAGTITDTRTGEALVAANVVVEGTNLGASSNVDGYYVILNVPPGTYRLRASLIGYATLTLVNVRVEIDQTTTSDVRLTEETVQAQEVVVVAERPIVQKDISASRANISAAEVEKLPVSTVAGVVGLQAGVSSTADGLFIVRGSGGTSTINGGGTDNALFLVNGQTLRDARSNAPFTNISLTSIEDIQVQTGGFNAEYGNVRSGLVNVVTKEGSKSEYSFAFIGRYRGAAPKHYEPGPTDPNAYWIRPYIDPAVCWTGTGNGAWDEFTQGQYPVFEGWNSIALKTLQNTNPNDDITPEAARQLFLFQHRKQTEITNSDFDVDMSFGGPMPFVSKDLGNLRFFASYRQSRSMYLVPLSDDALRDYTGQLKLTADVGEGMKLMVEGLIGKSTGTNDNNSGLPGLFTDPVDISDNGFNYSLGSYRDAAIFSYDYWCPSTINRNMQGVKFTHALNPTTYYDASISRFETKYETNPGPVRDIRLLYNFGGYLADEAPFGYPGKDNQSLGGGIGGNMNVNAGWSTSHDSSEATVYEFKFNINSQLDRYNQVQAGAYFSYTDNKVNYSRIEPNLPTNNIWSKWQTTPTQGALYVQDKIEFEGMIANLGLRLEYANAGGNWFDLSNTYDQRLGDARSLFLDSLLTVPTKKIVTLAPRLGIAFPVTDNSKIYFNYGHFFSLPVPEDQFLIRRSLFNQAITRLANPDNPFPRTIQYELGYEQNLFDQFLIRVAGYYKDVTDENKLVEYISADHLVDYTTSTSNQYRDQRGFELTLTKNRGNWIQGFVNYTYAVSTTGYFGVGRYYQDRNEQRVYLADNVYQTKPVPRPFARANIDLFTPEQYGPEVAGISLLGDWRVNFVASYSAGTYFTWTAGGTTAGVEYNAQWKDYFNVNMRLSKNFRIAQMDLQFFVDISNLLDTKYFSYALGFSDSKDYLNYMKSLHLPADVAGDETHPKFGYTNYPGSDTPGDYRTVPYEPYDPNDPDPAHKQYVLDNKAYIDMPNQPWLAFLNPRNVFYGIRIGYDF
jgi:hypothetical protein